MRVLITGALGFAGRHLASLCRQEGAEVVGLGRRSPDPPQQAHLDHYLTTDLSDASATVRAIEDAHPDRVFHLAAEASVTSAWLDPSAVLRNNVVSSLNLLEALRTSAPDARVLVAGSGEVYGPVPSHRLPVAETEPFRPQNAYALSKAGLDLMGGYYLDVHGLRVVRIRAFNHSGPGQSDAYVVAAFAKQIAEREAEGATAVTIMTGNTAPRRDFTDVRDVARAYWLALEYCDPGAFNVCSGTATSIADILHGLASETGLDVDHRVDRARTRQNDLMKIRGSHDKLTDATGWRPEITLDRTLRDTLDWWREKALLREGH